MLTACISEISENHEESRMPTMAAKPKTNKTSQLSFTCPVIGPNAYVTKGPSGWPEAFHRKKTHAKLVDFVKSIAPTIEVSELVDMFIAMRELAEKPEPTGWFTIVGFLGRQLGVHPNNVPHECGIAFWALVTISTIESGAN